MRSWKKSRGIQRKEQWIGIENIQKRLRVYYSDCGGIVYKNNKDGGISVFVTLLAQISC